MQNSPKALSLAISLSRRQLTRMASSLLYLTKDGDANKASIDTQALGSTFRNPFENLFRRPSSALGTTGNTHMALGDISFANIHYLSRRYYSSKTDTLPQFEVPKQLTFKEVEERVLKAIRAWDRFPQDRADQLTMDSRFIEDLALDSLDHVEIIMAIEDEFGFEISDNDAEKLKSPRDVHKFICEREDVYK